MSHSLLIFVCQAEVGSGSFTRSPEFPGPLKTDIYDRAQRHVLTIYNKITGHSLTHVFSQQMLTEHQSYNRVGLEQEDTCNIVLAPKKLLRDTDTWTHNVVKKCEVWAPERYLGSGSA